MTDHILARDHATLQADLLRLIDLHHAEACWLIDRGQILGPTILRQRWAEFAHGLRDTAALVATISRSTPPRPLAATLTPSRTRTR